MLPKTTWQFWIDVGGTFTDCIGRKPDGSLVSCKVLSASDDYGEASPLVGIRKLVGLEGKDFGSFQNLGSLSIKLGTTKGTNALLERKGADTALVITKGFGDLLEIGDQTRPKLFDLHIQKPSLLYKMVVEAQERISADGKIKKALNKEDITEKLKQVRANGIDSLAIVLINAYVNPKHEKAIADIAKAAGFSQVSVSSQLTPTIKVVDRGDTAVMDAYLSPVIQNYIQNIKDRIPECDLKLMTSAGGLVDAENYSGKDCILSGPAGGVVGFSYVAKLAGFDKAIGFDMGGTSTDVSRYSGEYEYEFSTEKAGTRIVAPMFAIETVAAGGGSICRFDGQKLVVGPKSSGADPGPACYGKGGPLSITDINLFNGKISEQHFPFPLDKAVVEKELRKVQQQVQEATGKKMDLREIADGFTKIANSRMAEAIKQISSAKGYDPKEHVLVSFGGAGAQHACAIARSLGIQKILLHPLAGILSAFGLGTADVIKFSEQTVLKSLNQKSLEQLEGRFLEMEEKLKKEILAENIEERNIQKVKMLDLRYRGEESAITVREPNTKNYEAEFEKLHQQLYGHSHENREIEIVNIRSELKGITEKPKLDIQIQDTSSKKEVEVTKTWFNGELHKTKVFQRELLRPGDIIDGPAIVLEELSTIIIDPGWTGAITERYDLILTDESKASRKISISVDCDPVYLELFNNHFTHIAKQMGITLQKIALSVNVKERLDFSCAILDAEGNLIVNAPHIPVHLGAMSECVKGLLDNVKELKPGDVYLTNDPNLGGTHLPDLTVITPVFDKKGKELLFLTASRAHHAEIGGLRPGSLYPFAKNLMEEGVVFRNLLIAKEGQFDEAILRKTLTEAPYPSRNPTENIADIKAQIAANKKGVNELQHMIDHYSWEVVNAYMLYIREVAEAKTREAIKNLKDGIYEFEDSLDDGAKICCKLNVEGYKLKVDFTGSAPVNHNSLNANKAIVKSCLLYCLRCLVKEEIPLNSGMLEPIELVLPEGMLNPPGNSDPAKQAAVVGGNVEISQRIVDVIFGALGITAASQGTMNNFVFGNKKFGYYETIGGGTGAGHDFNGSNAVHSHMTNTRITDVEVLEKRYPVVVNKFCIRKDSGGKGRFCGGDGIIREIEFLEPMEVSLLTQRRTKAPFGLKDGKSGKPGKNLLKKKGQPRFEDLGSLAQVNVEPGDIIRIETPGGGGWGRYDPS